MANICFYVSILLVGFLSVHAAPTRQERSVDKRETAKRVFWVEKKNADLDNDDDKREDLDKRVFWVEKKDAGLHGDFEAAKRVFWVDKKDVGAKADDDKRVFWVQKKAADDKDKRVFWVEKKDADKADDVLRTTLIRSEPILDCYTLLCVGKFEECAASCDEKGGHPACLSTCEKLNARCLDGCAQLEGVGAGIPSHLMSGEAEVISDFDAGL
ncbi:uncharacterized protein [Ptychodera flava]|uniref:uncharacterized protein isoform X2 n=1 Tax=Ptychodera flava TaxID=63121 RepID=UPI00396A6298